MWLVDCAAETTVVRVQPDWSLGSAFERERQTRHPLHVCVRMCLAFATIFPVYVRMCVAARTFVTSYGGAFECALRRGHPLSVLWVPIRICAATWSCVRLCARRGRHSGRQNCIQAPDKGSQPLRSGVGLPEPGLWVPELKPIRQLI